MALSRCPGCNASRGKSAEGTLGPLPGVEPLDRMFPGQTSTSVLEYAQSQGQGEPRLMRSSVPFACSGKSKCVTR